MNVTPKLTKDQAADVDLARQALEASIPDTDPANCIEHLGALEYHVQALLELITDLTGGVA